MSAFWLNINEPQTESCAESLARNKGERNVNERQSISTGLLWAMAISGKNRPAAFITLLKKNVFDQLHTGVQKKRSQILTQWFTTEKKTKKHSNQVGRYWKNTMYINEGTMDRYIRSTDSCVITSATILRSVHSVINYRRRDGNIKQIKWSGLTVLVALNRLKLKRSFLWSY